MRSELQRSRVASSPTRLELSARAGRTRWGAFIQYDSPGHTDPRTPFFPNFQSSINAVYANNGSLLPELYPTYADYWAAASGSGTTQDSVRDSWMNQKFFNGGGKVNWLIDRKNQSFPSSTSRVHPIFSASNHCCTSSNDSNNARFIDRVFYVYATQSQYRSLLLYSNAGGAGSYKWQSSASDPTWGVSVNTRDNWFKNLWVRYVVNGATTPNWSGPMPAP